MGYTEIAKTLYPDQYNDTDNFQSGPYEYVPIIKHFGEILLEWTEDNYQGDTAAIVKKDNKYGYLLFGWGSCSGCDALQACESYEDLGKLVEELENKVLWFDSLPKLVAFFRARDWTTQYEYNVEGFKENFLQKVLVDFGFDADLQEVIEDSN
jgi:hypothetical protein